MHSITEWVRVRPRHLRVIFYDRKREKRIAALMQMAANHGVPLQPRSEETLSTMVGTNRHQGVTAATDPFPYSDLEQVIQGQPRLLVVADQIQDPHNLGALLRTASACAVGAVLIPKDGGVGITPTVEASAAGAAALIPVCRVVNVRRTLETLQEQSYWCVGLMPRGAANLYEIDPPERVVIVLGSETGMRPLVVKQCDLTVSIPMRGPTESLNAAVAAGLALYELRRRWGDWSGQLDRNGSVV